MDEYFASMPVNNATVLCVGSITKSEAESVSVDGVQVDGMGYYLFLAEESEPASPIKVLAKFLSAFEAEDFARLLQNKARRLSAV